MTHQQMEIKMKELEKRINALEQTSSDCRICKKWDECPCGKEGHENGTSIGYSVGECKEYEQEPFKPIEEIDFIQPKKQSVG